MSYRVICIICLLSFSLNLFLKQDSKFSNIIIVLLPSGASTMRISHTPTTRGWKKSEEERKKGKCPSEYIVCAKIKDSSGREINLFF